MGVGKMGVGGMGVGGMAPNRYFALPLAFNSLRHCENNPKSIALVVSPLIALMKDQVKTLYSRGVRGVRIGDADEETHAQIYNGQFSWCL